MLRHDSIAWVSGVLILSIDPKENFGCEKVAHFIVKIGLQTMRFTMFMLLIWPDEKSWMILEEWF